MTVIQLSRGRLMFRSAAGEHAHVSVPADLQDHVNAVMDWVESYRSPQQQAQDAILEAAFDSGEVEPIVLVALVKAWTEGEAVKVGDLRSHEGIVYKATKEHTTAAVKGTLDETGFWVAYKAKMKEE
jgi:hypothetical protein